MNIRKIFGGAVILLSFAIGLYLHELYIESELEKLELSKRKDFQLMFLGDQILSRHWPGDEIEVGGLSGLAWSSGENLLYAVSDDRGRSGPSRFYKLRLDLEGKVPKVYVQSSHVISDKNGKPFPERSFDPEGIAIDAAGWVYISSEGDFKDNPLAYPLIMRLNQNGKSQGKMVFEKPFFPKDSSMANKDYGIRYNLAFESLDVFQRDQILFTATESALLQDGDIAGTENGADLRIAAYQLSEQEPFFKLRSHWVYPLGAIPARAPQLSSVNGLTDIVALSEATFLTLERAYLAGRSSNRARLFFTDCQLATNVSGIEALRDATFERCKKDLIYDFGQLIGLLSEEHPRIDNLEGVVIGPELKEGGRLLIVVSDNNFREAQKTQFLFFRLKAPGL